MIRVSFVRLGVMCFDRSSSVHAQMAARLSRIALPGANIRRLPTVAGSVNLRLFGSGRFRWQAIAAVSLMVGCREPTQVIVELSTDIKCADHPNTGIATGNLGGIEKRPFATETNKCDETSHRIGSIVLTPETAKDGEFAVRVATAMGGPAEGCVGDKPAAGCVVALRAVRFVPHSTLYLPIRMEASCIDVPCEKTQTCRNGACTSAIIDPNDCNGRVCDVGTGGSSGTSGGASSSGASSVSAGTSDLGGSSGAGGANSAGGTVATGGTQSTGGTLTGGTSATGGAATGGTPATGGVASGGAVTGGAATGGAVTAETFTTGGAATGGAATGGATTGGVATGGAATGGTSAIGGATTAMGGSTNSTAYTIGHNEVPMPLYALWLAGNPSTDGQPPECSWNTSFTPTCNWEPMKYLLHPVVCVDWCDAYAYCKAMGQRLCGKIGGGANDFNQFSDATQSQWQELCTSGGQFSYPYATTYSSTACNGSDSGNGKVVDVGSMKDCQSPDSNYARYFDMSGNVMEWEDSCRSSDDNCRLRGGSYNSTTPASLSCAADASAPRSTTAADIGFRCCPSP